MNSNNESSKGIKYIAYLIIGIILVILAIYIYTTPTNYKVVTTNSIVTNSTYSFYAPKNVSIEITDPLELPTNTTSLYINYTGFRLGLSNNSVINTNYRGRINLLNLSNYSQVLGVVKIKRGILINNITLYLENGHMSIGNKTYNLSTPNSFEFNSTLFNKSDLGLLIDLNPSVIQFYNSSENQSSFGFEPYGYALGLNKTYLNKSDFILGKKLHVNFSINARLNQFKPNLTISNEKLVGYKNNSTLFSFTLTNNNNYPVTIRNVMLFGSMNIVGLNYTGITPMMPYKFGYNQSGKFNVNGSGFGYNQSSKFNINSSGKGISGVINSSYKIKPIFLTNHSLISNTIINKIVVNSSFSKFVFNERYHNVLNFLISDNGELYIPHLNDMHQYINSGYVIAPHSNYTFVYLGEIYLFNNYIHPINSKSNVAANASMLHGNISVKLTNYNTSIRIPFNKPIAVVPINGSNYTMFINGERGVDVSVNLTAS